jgi:hypothetical protein
MTNFSLAYMQSVDNFVAPTVFPVVSVALESGVYAVYPKGFFLRTEMAARPLGGRPRQAGYAVESKSYRVEEYGLEKAIDDRTRRNSRDPLGPDRGAVRFLSANALIHREVEWAAKFFRIGIWSTELTGVAAAPGANQILQFNQAGSSPLTVAQNVKTRLKLATGYEPNVLVVGQDVHSNLVNHPEIVERIKYSQLGVVTNDLLAQFFAVDEYRVAGAVQNIAKEGQVDQLAFIADPKAMLFAYATENPSTDEPTAGAIFAWDDLVPGQTNEQGGVIERYRDDRAHSDYYQIRNAWDMRATASDLAVFISNAVA